jgi:hypothetical protein
MSFAQRKMPNDSQAPSAFWQSKGHGNGNANGSANKTSLNFLTNNSLIQINTVTNPQITHTGMSGTTATAVAVGSLVAGAGIAWAAAMMTKEGKSSPSAIADSKATAESTKRRA